MCGIAGVISFEQPVSDEVLTEMRDTLVHRGPDDAGTWISGDERVGLASRRLAILDLSPTARMPMVDGESIIVHNGEIYNFVELREELRALGHEFRTGSDTEVLLKSYREWGTDCLPRLNGMFAFAIWDGRKRQLFAARDRFGEKPFYYAKTPQGFVFASEIKALRRHPWVSTRPNEAAIFRYLVAGAVDGREDSFYEGIQQLQPAHYLTHAAAGAPRIGRYWDLDPERRVAFSDPNAYAERFFELFQDAIRIRLRSDVPVGTSLSGGLDSSMVVCTMRLASNGNSARQNTFSARYREGGVDEGRYIQAVVDATGVFDHHVWIRGEDLLEEVDRFLYHQDEPVAHTSQFAQWKVYQLAREHGVTVLLDGQGADEVLGGYHPPTFGGYYAALLRSGRWLGLARELGHFRANHGSVVPALRYLGATVLPEAVRARVRMRYHGSAGLLAQEWHDRFRDTVHSAKTPSFATPLRRKLYEILTESSLPSLLRYADRNSMAHSREARLPFLDHRLVEFVYGVPDEQLVDRATTKVLLRSAARDLLPVTVRKRQDKVGFSTPEADWLRGPLRPWVEEKLDGARRRGVVTPDEVSRAWKELLAGGGRPAQVWRLANLEAWFEGAV